MFISLLIPTSFNHKSRYIAAVSACFYLGLHNFVSAIINESFGHVRKESTRHLEVHTALSILKKMPCRCLLFICLIYVIAAFDGAGVFHLDS